MLERKMTVTLLRVTSAAIIGLTGLAPAGASAASHPKPKVAKGVTLAHVDRKRTINDVSCPSVSFCAGVDSAGNAITSTHPRGGKRAWKVRRVDSGRGLLFVSCPSPALCVATDNGGDIISSAHPTGGSSAWSVAHIAKGSNRLVGISCPTSSLCVAADANGNIYTSTAPAGGAAAWRPFFADVSPGGGGFDSISCPSSSLCYAVDNLSRLQTITNLTGTPQESTTTYTFDRFASGELSCPTASACVQGAVLAVVSSNDPQGGTGAWHTSHPFFHSRADLVAGVSCATASFCAVAGGLSDSLQPSAPQDGELWVSGNPVSGGGTWHAKLLERHLLVGVSCPSSSLCVAGDDAGDLLAVKKPATIHSLRPSTGHPTPGGGGGRTPAPTGR